MGQVQHAFRVGERVIYTGSIGSVKKCVVRQLVPPLGIDFQYRIRDETEPFDRVVVEGALNPDVSAPGFKS